MRNPRRVAAFIACVLILLTLSPAALATGESVGGGDPLKTIDNLSVFIFGAIRAIGIILLGFGIVQLGLSLKSHDPSQRANGFLTVFGGIVITFAKEILELITGTTL
ncbi:glutamyl-tRNA amidotransferase [Oscillospiraceae bacterium OttesenSCG-928-F05]|nr:glutamyl-tRNA amidotransferase [Oscillospiraceae bacterium OttesenSCG-928-F05]